MTATTSMPRYTEVLERAERAASVEDAADLARIRDLFTRNDPLTTPEVAAILGVSSPNTISTWLDNGHFPGAYRTAGGHRRFPIHAVLEMKARLEEKRARALRPAEVQVIDFDPYAGRDLGD